MTQSEVHHSAVAIVIRCMRCWQDYHLPATLHQEVMPGHVHSWTHTDGVSDVLVQDWAKMHLGPFYTIQYYDT